MGYDNKTIMEVTHRHRKSRKKTSAEGKNQPNREKRDKGN